MWGYSGYSCEVKISKPFKGLSALITTELEKSLDTRDQICFNIYITESGVAYNKFMQTDKWIDEQTEQ
jgi:hypothetical protein